MTAAATQAPAGTCTRCQQPVKTGAGVLVDVHQGTGASPGVLIHRSYCAAPYVRRSNG